MSGRPPKPPRLYARCLCASLKPVVAALDCHLFHGGCFEDLWMNNPFTLRSGLIAPEVTTDMLRSQAEQLAGARSSVMCRPTQHTLSIFVVTLRKEERRIDKSRAGVLVIAFLLLAPHCPPEN